jgi:hypothetical protein
MACLIAKRTSCATAATAFGPITTSTRFGVTVVKLATHHVAALSRLVPVCRTLCSLNDLKRNPR